MEERDNFMRFLGYLVWFSTAFGGWTYYRMQFQAWRTGLENLAADVVVIGSMALLGLPAINLCFLWLHNVAFSQTVDRIAGTFILLASFVDKHFWTVFTVCMCISVPGAIWAGMRLSKD